MYKENAAKWLKQALHDLEIAERAISIEGYDTAAFLAQQSIEKLFKAILVSQGKLIRKIHNLEELGLEIGVPDDVITCIIGLTADYMISRYPDFVEDVPFEQYDRELARQKVDSAKKAFELLKSQYKDLEE